MSYKNKDILKEYIFEYVERIVRFYQHIDKIEEQSYPNNGKSDGNEVFIANYKECLMKLFRMAIGFSHVLEKDDVDKHFDEIFNQINDNINLINKFHNEQLKHLPRPKTPIELQRFSRIIDKQIEYAKSKTLERNKEKKKIQIYVTDKTSEETEIPHPLAEFEDYHINSIINSYNDKNYNNTKIDGFHPKDEYLRYYVQIPRIETSNPCRWPSLIHELSHHLYRMFYRNNIEDEFLKEINSRKNDIVNTIIKKYNINLNGWLKECWCDLIATFIIGPSFCFSQYSANIMNRSSIKFHDEDEEHNTHPPAYFRLKLIKRLIDHRIFNKTRYQSLEESINISLMIIEKLDSEENKGFVNNDDIKHLYVIFKDFYFKKFLIDNHEVIDMLKPFVKYTLNIDSKNIRKHVKDIEKNRPIPSVIKFKKVIEEPSSIQDILLSSWMYRKKTLQTIINNMIIANFNVELESGDINALFCEKILNEFNKFDQIILRSIQVSEWFDLYNPFNKPKVSTHKDIKLQLKKYEDKLSTITKKHIITDTGIYEYIKTDQLKIIPIMNICNQLGTSSIDIRLGTSFQLYFPNRAGILDFTNNDSIKEYSLSSQLVDLDFTKSIVIAPKQFMLAHSMEYLELPDYLSADLEGRSSIARLGLEIHVTAGFIDPGFTGAITFELFNSGPNPIRLFPGLRIAQLRFTEVDIPSITYDKKKNTKYKELLAHNLSLQFKDMEINRLRNKLNEKG